MPGDSNVVVTLEDYYVLGILTSNVHRVWMKAQKSTLKSDIAYTHKTCFETFPFLQYLCKGEWPFAPTGKIVQQIRNKTIELHEYRTQQMEKKQWGITQLYNAYFHEPASKLYQLYQELDKLVMQAYNFKANDDILAKLLELNLDITLKPPRSDWLPKFGGLRGKSKQLNVKQQLFRCPLRFEKSEEGYAVWCPGLPGCCSQVETETEALEIYPQVYAKALKDSLRSHLRSLS